MLVVLWNHHLTGQQSEPITLKIDLKIVFAFTTFFAFGCRVGEQRTNSANHSGSNVSSTLGDDRTEQRTNDRSSGLEADKEKSSTSEKNRSNSKNSSQTEESVDRTDTLISFRPVFVFTPNERSRLSAGTGSLLYLRSDSTLYHLSSTGVSSEYRDRAFEDAFVVDTPVSPDGPAVAVTYNLLGDGWISSNGSLLSFLEVNSNTIQSFSSPFHSERVDFLSVDAPSFVVKRLDDNVILALTYDSVGASYESLPNKGGAFDYVASCSAGCLYWGIADGKVYYNTQDDLSFRYGGLSLNRSGLNNPITYAASISLVEGKLQYGVFYALESNYVLSLASEDL